MEGNADADALRAWQTQARGAQSMSLDEVKTRAERLDAGTRRWRVWTPVLFVLIVVVETWQVWRETDALERAGDLLTIAALFYVSYRFLTQRLAARPDALGRTSCRDFYRAELLRQRDLSRDSWGYLLPFVPGVALSLVGSRFVDRPLAQVIGFAAFGVALFLGIAWWNTRTARRLQNDIDALDAS
jgi:hypothetical protein